MFCPTCGRENPSGRKFCSSCGTNLEAVTQALTGSAEGPFSKFDTGLDYFIARYAERVFKDAPSHVLDAGAGKSWRILGQGILTSFVDMILFFLLWNIIPLRFFMLLITSPIKLLSRKSSGRKIATSEIEDKRTTAMPDSSPQRWIVCEVASVTEHTTVNLPDAARTKENRASETK
ncbi:MAG TPA: zinc ribbon domain-containing protein [Blastocatellia bacterium]|nr:zinc ribbon domain-containing protein [Blastocatellia bacterium]